MLYNVHNVLHNGYICECGKQYKHRQHLSRHKKTCEIFKNTTPQNEMITNDATVLIITFTFSMFHTHAYINL